MQVFIFCFKDDRSLDGTTLPTDRADQFTLREGIATRGFLLMLGYAVASAFANIEHDASEPDEDIDIMVLGMLLETGALGENRPMALVRR